ncbi:MAG: PAS domain-containing protein [Niastella sp.]|nr:PAS domain-containing protein [Niastella sp.]
MESKKNPEVESKPDYETLDPVSLQKKAAETEHLLRSVVESAPFPIGVYTGREMRISLANHSIMDVWGKGHEVIGKTYHEVLPELADQHIYQQLDDVYTKGIPFHARNQRVDLVVDGKLQPFYFNYSFTPIYNIDGSIYGVMNTAAEVTDIVLAKQKVEQSEQNFKNMILQAPVAMCILTGPDHVVEIVNDLMIELWGKPVETVMNKPVFDALPDAREQGLEALMKQVYETGESFHANERPVELVRKGKLETTYQNFVYEPYKNAEGRILGVLAITINVTEQVMARQKIEEIVAARTKELAEANANLERSNEELAQFAYIASHDLQEPLRKVSIYIQMLENHLSHIDDRSRGYFDKIKTSSARMLSLIRDVLAYSQLSQETETFEAVDINKVIAEISTDFELLIQQTNATIEYSNLPVIEAIPLQMSQLFGNLISNALKFIKPGMAPVITITAEPANSEAVRRLNLREGSYYYFKVADNGIGFNPEKSEQIFNIFQRLHGKKQYQGTGIGLAMCRKIVQNHHGAIYATAEEGNGAVFHIIVPAAHLT